MDPIDPRKVRAPDNDTQTWMLWLAQKANVEYSRCRRMVLVLDIDDVPRLYLETYLQQPGPDAPEMCPLPPLFVTEEGYGKVNTTLMQDPNGQSEKVEDPQPDVIDTTSVQNNKWRTKTPRSSYEVK